MKRILRLVRSFVLSSLYISFFSIIIYPRHLPFSFSHCSLYESIDKDSIVNVNGEHSSVFSQSPTDWVINVTTSFEIEGFNNNDKKKWKEESITWNDVHFLPAWYCLMSMTTMWVIINTWTIKETSSLIHHHRLSSTTSYKCVYVCVCGRRIPQINRKKTTTTHRLQWLLYFILFLLLYQCCSTMSTLEIIIKINLQWSLLMGYNFDQYY